MQETSRRIAVNCQNVHVRFNKTTSVLDGIDLAVREGERLALIGPSGCGKSTLLRSIAGLQAIDSGTIELGLPIHSQKHLDSRAALGSALPSPVSEKNTADEGTEDSLCSAKDVGFVFQEAVLLPWRTVWQNVRLPIELRKRRTTQADRLAVDRRLEMLLRTVGLAEADWGKLPTELSGGMKMRVSLARTLSIEPRVLLLDEPFAALDDLLRNRLNDLLLSLSAKSQATMIFVTHNIAEAVYLSHRVAILASGKLQNVLENPLPEQRSSDMRSSTAFAEFYGIVSAELANSVEACLNETTFRPLTLETTERR